GYVFTKIPQIFNFHFSLNSFHFQSSLRNFLPRPQTQEHFSCFAVFLTLRSRKIDIKTKRSLPLPLLLRALTLPPKIPRIRTQPRFTQTPNNRLMNLNLILTLTHMLKNPKPLTKQCKIPLPFHLHTQNPIIVNSSLILSP
ncbi:hypothetical protein PanWU01x14_290430, partial [Parasponia andersonii]